MFSTLSVSGYRLMFHFILFFEFKFSQLKIICSWLQVEAVLVVLRSRCCRDFL